MSKPIWKIFGIYYFIIARVKFSIFAYWGLQGLAGAIGSLLDRDRLIRGCFFFDLFLNTFCGKQGLFRFTIPNLDIRGGLLMSSQDRGVQYIQAIINLYTGSSHFLYWCCLSQSQPWPPRYTPYRIMKTPEARTVDFHHLGLSPGFSPWNTFPLARYAPPTSPVKDAIIWHGKQSLSSSSVKSLDSGGLKTLSIFDISAQFISKLLLLLQISIFHLQTPHSPCRLELSTKMDVCVPCTLLIDMLRLGVFFFFFRSV